MDAKHAEIGDGPGILRTTLLDLVQSLIDQDLSPDEVVRIVHESIDGGDVVLIGNFREGIGEAPGADETSDSSAPRGVKQTLEKLDRHQLATADASATTASDRREEEAEARWSALMTAAQDGDADAYRRLLEDLLPVVAHLVRSRLFDSSSVDDVVQNALLKMHRARHTFRPERPFGPWMRAIVRNATIDHLRQVRRRLEREANVESIELIQDPKSGCEPERNELSCELARMLAKLPPGQRQAVELIQVNGLSVAEASGRVGISPGALKLRAHRGYRALRERMMHQEADGTNINLFTIAANEHPSR